MRRASPHTTYWSINVLEPERCLGETYTLPYLKIIQRHLPAGSRIHLVTLEKGIGPHAPCQLSEGLEHHPFQYHPLGYAGGIRVGRNDVEVGPVGNEAFREYDPCMVHPGRNDRLHGFHVYAQAVVIHSYEPHAEAMVENGTWSRNGIAFRVLFLFERLQSKRAVALIAAAAGMNEYAAQIWHS